MRKPKNKKTPAVTVTVIAKARAVSIRTVHRWRAKGDPRGWKMIQQSKAERDASKICAEIDAEIAKLESKP